MTEWRTIPGFAGAYEASDEGHVRRVKSDSLGRVVHVGRLIAEATTKSGYKRVGLKLGEKQRFFYVHRLVCAAFHGEPPVGFNPNHKDGDKVNNREKNLEWCSRSDNQRHAYDVLGREAPRGVDHWNAKKTPELVREIRRRAAAGESHVSIARSLNLPRSNVTLIVNRKSWAHVV